MNLRNKILLGLSGLLLLVGIPAAIFLSQQQQETRSRASASTTLSFNPTSSASSAIQSTPNSRVSLDVMVTPGSNRPSLIKLEIVYDPTKLQPTALPFVVNTTAFPETREGPIVQNGKILISVSVGSDPSKAISQVTKVGTVNFNTVAATESPSQVSFGPSSLVTSVASTDQSSENVLSTTSPAYVSVATPPTTPPNKAGDGGTAGNGGSGCGSNIGSNGGAGGIGSNSTGGTGGTGGTGCSGSGTGNTGGTGGSGGLGSSSGPGSNGAPGIAGQGTGGGGGGGAGGGGAPGQAGGRGGNGGAGCGGPGQAGLPGEPAPNAWTGGRGGRGGDGGPGCSPTVTPPPTTSSMVCSPTSVVLSGTMQNLSTTLKNSAGAGIAGKTIQWTSSNSQVSLTPSSSQTNTSGLATVSAGVTSTSTTAFTTVITARFAGDTTASTSACTIQATYTPPTSPPTQPPTAPPTLPPTSTKLNISVFLHGIGNVGDSVNPTVHNLSNKNPLTRTRLATVEIINTTNLPIATASGSIVFDSTTGNFKGTVDFGQKIVSGGLHNVKIKEKSHLRSPAVLHNITLGQTNTIPDVALIAGDINNDYYLNILDYNILIGCYSDLLPAASCTTTNKPLADLNDNGVVNQFDYNLILREFANRTI